MSVVCGRHPTTVRSVPQALLPVTRLVTIYNHLKHLQIGEDVQNSGKCPLAGPQFRTGGFDGSELILQSSWWSHGGDHISALAAGYGAVLTDGGQ